MKKPLPSMTPQELREIRDKLGYSQTVMAGHMGVSLRGYQAWEDATGGQNARAIPGPAVLLARKLLAEFENKS